MENNRPHTRTGDDTARLCEASGFPAEGFEDRTMPAVRESILKQSELLRILSARSLPGALCPASKADSRKDEPGIIAFRGIREGIGTTTLASAAARFLSRHRPPVLVVDASSSPLGIGAHFGLPAAESGWNDRVHTEESLPLWEHDSDLFFLPKGEEGFRKNPGCLSDPSLVESLCALLKRAPFSDIVVDTGTDAHSPWLDRAHCIVTVLSPDANAYARLSRQEARPNECFVLNGRHPGHDSDHDLSALFLTHPALGERLFQKPLPFDELLRQALHQGRPAAEAFPYSASVKAHAGLAAWLRLMFVREGVR